ncbi:MAG TPA: hypothetical protein VM576_08990 [Xanthomonadaceae bacterium]|nr:hypothetical protein [Xanthomonadaceae bacterium]
MTPTMSVPSLLDTPPPVPDPALLLQPFGEGLGAATGSPRFLVDSGERQRVVDARVHELLVLLREAPASWHQLAERLRARTGETVDAGSLRRLVLERLPPDWFGDKPVARARRSPFLLQRELVGGARLAPLTAWLARLYRWPVAIPVITVFFLIEALALPAAAQHMHDARIGMDTVLLFAALFATIVVHELGHLSACARTGTPHGGMGIGLYWVMPAMYADVSKAWRMRPAARVLVDVGGIYFQAWTAIAIGVWALATGDAFAYRLLWAVTFTMLHTLNPFFKFDGYWLLSDAAGLTNLHAQVRRTVAGLVGRVFGLGVPSPEGGLRRRLRVVYAYTILCGVYLAYVLDFLHGQIAQTLAQYPSRIAAAWQQAAAAWNARALSAVAHAMAEILAASAWPACLAVFSGVLAWTLLSRALAVGCEFAAGSRSVENNA